VITGDFVVAVTLAETDIAPEVADKWIAIGVELKMSVGWNCYCWLLGNRKDREFSEGKKTDILDAMSEETCGKAGDHERTTGRSAGRDESGNL